MAETTAVIANNSPEVQAAARIEQEESLHRTMAEIVPMFDLEPEAGREAFSAFVDKRIEELSRLDSGKQIGFLIGGSDTFVAPSTEMVASAIVGRPYYLDDPDAYKRVFDGLSAAYKQAVHPDRNAQSVFLNAAVTVTNVEQANYFGGLAGSDERRQAILVDEIDFSAEEPPRISIADLKGVALCQERAAIVHNTLQILGFTSSKIANGFLRGEAQEQEAHMFVRLTGANGEYIFDPTNPIIVKGDDQTVVGIKPAMYKIEDASTGVQEVTITDQSTAEDGTPLERARHVVYVLEVDHQKDSGWSRL